MVGETGFEMSTSHSAIVAAGAVPDTMGVEIGRPSEAEVTDRLKVVVDRLQKLAAEQVRLRGPIEERWLRNIRQFHGKYDADTERELVEAKKSRAFVKVTRKKTNSWKGRLESLIFPTDDRNYGIQPTPVPSLTSASKQVVEKAMALVEQANEQAAAAAAAAQQGDQAGAEQAAATGAQIATTADDHALQAKQLAEDIKEAKKRAEAMQEVMDDQLIECQFAAEGRSGIFDLALLGTCVIKGPLASERSRGKWVPQKVVQDDGSNKTVHAYQRDPDPAPIFRKTDLWSYFPDMAARKKGEEEFEFERHLWTQKDLRRLVRENGFNPDAVRRLLQGRPRDRTLTDAGLTYLADLRSVTGDGETLKGRHVGWEYHGPLECEEIVTMLHALGEHDEAQRYKDSEDPLIELKVIAYFCEGELLKIAPEYPLDSQESLYSVANFEPSEASIFGYGVPEVIEDSQAALNAAWRMCLDNAGLSTGPQIVVDRDSVEPANKVWEMTPRKIWYKKKGAAASQPFEVFNIPSAAVELLNIVKVAREFIDDEAQLPVQSEGEVAETPNVTATASNIMALGFNVTFRSVVKSWDDGITSPSMRRLYDWNMQHNPREDIKGDMSIDARGTSVLLVREIQSQTLMMVAQNHTTHPVLSMMLDPYETYKQALKSAMIAPDDIMVDKDEFKNSIKQQADAAQQQDPRVQAAQMMLDGKKLELQTQLQIADVHRQTEMIRLAEQRNMKLDDLQTLLNVEKMKIDSKERMFAGELGAEERNATADRAAGREPTGSGGYISAGSKPVDAPKPAQ